MGVEQIQRETTPEGFRVQMANMVMDRKKHSEQHFTGIRKELPQLYDLYRGILTGRFSPHRNNVHIPLIFSTIQSDVARKIAASFGEWPIVQFVGYGPDDAPVARKREALISAQMKDCSSVMKAYDLLLSADLYGTAVAQIGWNHVEQEMALSHTTHAPINGEALQHLIRKRIVTFDGPDWRVMDCLDIFPQPSFRYIDEMQWFITREYMDLDDVRALAAPDDEGRTVFDPEEVSRLEREGAGAVPALDDYKNWRSIGRTLFEAEARVRERYARPMEILTQWGVVPSELAPDGIRMRVITVANGRYVLRNRPNPLWSGKKPIRAYSPTPDAHYFWAPGKAEILKRLQIVANRFTNQQLDALDIFIDPVFLYNKDDTALDTRNLLIKPGKWIGVGGTPQEIVQPLVPNLSGMQAGTAMTETVWRWMQQGSGIVEDTVMGGLGQRQTAREYLGRSEATATRLALETRLFEEFFLEPLADDFVDLDRQFLTLPHEVFILGQNAVLDPVTGKEIPQHTRQEVDGWDLVPNYEARALGASTAIGKQQRQQGLTFLLQAASQNPIAAGAVNWVAFFRQIFQAFDIKNINELLNTNEQAQAIAQGAGASAPSQVPEIPGTPNQPPAAPYRLAEFMGQGRAQ